MSRRRLRPVLSVLVPLALFAAACGSDEESEGTSATTAAPAATSATTAAPAATSAPAETAAPTSVQADTTAPADTTENSAAPVELDDSDPVTILFVAGFTGPTSKSVADAELGMRGAIADVEANGGILGRTIELETLDTGGDPTQAVSVFQGYLTEHDKPDFVVPGISSAEALALVPVLAREKIVSMNNAANPGLNDPALYPYHFGYSVTAAGLVKGVPNILTEMGAESVAVITPNDAYGSSIADAVEAALEGTGIEMTLEQFNPADLDISVSYERAISNGPDAVFFEAIGDITQRLVETRLAVGATDIPTIAGFGVSSIGGGPADWADPDALENLEMQVFRFQKFLEPEEYSDIQTRFFAEIEALGGLTSNVLTPGLFWDVVHMVAAASNQAGSTDGDAVKELLESEGFEIPELMMWSDHGYTPERHFPDPPAEDFSATRPGLVVNGMFQEPEG